jgi:hypothetical protein
LPSSEVGGKDRLQPIDDPVLWQRLDHHGGRVAQRRSGLGVRVVPAGHDDRLVEPQLIVQCGQQFATPCGRDLVEPVEQQHEPVRPEQCCDEVGIALPPPGPPARPGAEFREQLC